MSDSTHPHWGRIIDDYDGTYVYDPKTAREKVSHSQREMNAFHTIGAEAINRLHVLGESSADPDWNDPSSCVTLSMFKSLVAYTAFPCLLLKLADPFVIRGCIKLLKSITRFGRPSPFSYEYGYLCFRILLLVLDYCFSFVTCEHETWLRNAIKPKNQLLKGGYAPMLSSAVSELIDKYMVGNSGDYYKHFLKPLPWTDWYTTPLIHPQDIRTLTEIIDQDRKHFLIFSRSNYSLRLSALLFTTLQVMHHTPPTPEHDPFVQGFLRVYTRNLLIAPGSPCGWGWQHDYVTQVAREHKSTGQPLDAEDSKLVIRAYTDRLTILSDSSPLHPQATPHLAAELLQYVLPLVGDDCDSLVSLIRVTIKCMWKDMPDDPEEPVPAEVIDPCLELFENFKNLFETLGKRTDGTGASTLAAAVQALIDENINGLFERLIPDMGSPGDEDGTSSAVMEARLDFLEALPREGLAGALVARMTANNSTSLVNNPGAWH
ncbi:hypothetical protein RSOLAG22IIIB_12182 [Rhizoctonia solani]|uniref:Uncharacterized protein n=1 Tax=Rhizoctonia solani TaxID=456999 RepID=A0A0K6GCU4_9AGAM|nr:hypothetical protein RSOLAG22IIIB_12182 [Rhizoctonia solani]